MLTIVWLGWKHECGLIGITETIPLMIRLRMQRVHDQVLVSLRGACMRFYGERLIMVFVRILLTFRKLQTVMTYLCTGL
jgi:hypothetical protein